ncbi:hypothetical protein SERLA73DRAFT_69068 [Serpula lacrymans var. lacrymans S7.3]|uniref:Uncharacterized protein n=2 Tax=Serpula lacrymans var. lacrymans TaxID=341189 RepID=F8PJ03_SERL3|nr:uncharacterized protein SERLADRAFT_432953 [Serpula lacrymans var. lacrymans S7.9]EGO03164.1 hypothetical protein SERLA73DRAFT_69068 [Serpula lacrymans var. lacrymans S7.3]EGO28947.1 hypothetical protein SERLADRAFT_432953 [Serpula lacrymans var. lacrymans S7.9]
MADSITTPDRSVSRGRDAFQSSGRGGIGNIRRSSISTDTRPTDGPDDFSPTRGREPAVNADRVFSVGRGGAGNIRSPSRDIGPDHPQTASILSDHAAANADYERQVRKLHAEANPVHSSGRGGLGNISASRSRSKGPSPALHSTGRGGAGNIQYGDGLNADILDQEERRKHAHGEGMHSTGRGGVANLTSSRGPSLEIHGHHAAEFESSGRGGAGNIRSRSASRDPSGRTPSREKHGIAALWNKVSHPQYNSRPSDQSIHSLHSDAASQDGGALSPRND